MRLRVLASTAYAWGALAIFLLAAGVASLLAITEKLLDRKRDPVDRPSQTQM